MSNYINYFIGKNRGNFMKNLIPNFIADNFEKNESTGSFYGSVLSLDLKGFTKMTEELMQNGRYGAENLSDIINSIFEPIINTVHKNGGFISAFIGDAITAVFPDKFSGNSVITAENILDYYSRHKTVTVEKSTFKIELRIGIAYGKIQWGIINGDTRSIYYFKGDTVYRAADAQQSVKEGEYKIDSTELRIKNTAKNNIESKNENISSCTLKKFIPDNIIKMKTKGEFREIVSVFISFNDGKTDIKEFFRFLCDKSCEYKGYLNKVDFGDKGGIALVLFGAPTAYENSPENAVSFAFDAVKLFKGIKIGISKGVAFCGFIGSTARGEYTALGKVVNLSARLLTKCDDGGIILDEKISACSFKNFTVKQAGSYEFKGFKNKLKIFVPERTKSGIKSSDRNIFIGREKELKHIHNFIMPLFEGKNAGFLQINGDPGIGKSRLISAARSSVEANSVKWFYLSCDDTLKKSFNPFDYFFKNYFCIDEKNTAQENLKIFSGKFSEIKKLKSYESLINYNVMEYFIGRLIGLEIRNEAFESIGKKEIYENTIFSIRSFFHLLASSAPVIIEIDDLHNIDICSKDAVESVFNNSENFPLCLIASSRFNSDGSVYNLNIKAPVPEFISLTCLDRNSVNSLSESILGSKLSPRLSEMLWHKSTGNPFYTEQTSLYLKESGCLTKKGEILELSSTDIEIPDRISAIIISRIDRLSSELKKLIRTASVLGKEFSVKLLTAVLKRKNISTELDKAEKEAIWDKASEIFYIFKHGLLRDTVYEMQLKKTLRELHFTTAETIEKIYSGEIKTHSGELAYHYEKAEIRNKTKYYLNLAGDFCMENYMNSEAEQHFTKLLSYCDTDIETAIAKKNLGDVLFRSGDWKKSEKILRESYSDAGRAKNAQQTVISGLSLAEVIGETGGIDKAVRLFNKLLKISVKNDLENEKYHIYVNLGVLYREISGNYKRSVQFYEDALKYFIEKKSNDDVTAIYDNLGVTYANTGNYKKAFHYFRLAEKSALKNNDLFGLMNIYNNEGFIHSYRGEYDKTLAVYDKSLELAEKLGIKRHEGIIFGNFGAAYFYMGEFQKALDYCLKGLDVSKQLGDEINECHMMSTIGVLYRKLGHPEKSLECFEKQKDLALKMNIKNLYSIAIGNIAFMFTLTGEFEKSNIMYEESTKLCLETDDKVSLVTNYLNMAENYKYLKNFRRSLKLYEQAIKISTELDLKFHLVPAYFYSSEVYKELNDLKSALDNLEKCRSVATELNRKDYIFKCAVAFNLIDNSKPAADRVKLLISLDSDELSEEDKAMLYKAVFKISGSKEFKKKALKLYTELYKKLKYYDYKMAVNELK